MENKELLLQYNEYLKNIAKHLARIQMGRTFEDQWPVNAYTFNYVLGDGWILETPKVILNKNLNVGTHSNKLSFLFLPLLEKKTLLKEYDIKTVKNASLELFKMLKDIRRDPGCAECLNIHKDKPKIGSFLYGDIDKLKMIIGLLSSISEMSSPIYRGLSYEFHGSYDNVCVREYYIDFNPIVNIKFNCKIVEKVIKPFKVDFFGHVITPEEQEEYTLFLNNKEIEPKELIAFLLDVFSDIRSIFNRFDKKELVIGCAKLICKKLQNMGLKTNIRENFEISEIKFPEISYNDWIEIIWNKTLDHLKI